MRLIFYGTPAFALPSLLKLQVCGHSIAAVVTRIDQPAGRGLALRPPPVKEFAKTHNLTVYQPEKISDRDFLDEMMTQEFDLGVVVAYGQFLPLKLLHLPKHRTINVHPSLLPKYRGAAPINWTLINGETQTGVSIIYLTQEMDAGDIILQRSLDIEADDNAEILDQKLGELGATCLIEAIELIERNAVKSIPQDKSGVIFAPPLNKEMGWLNWLDPATELHNLVRGLNPHWSTRTRFRGQALKIKKTRVGTNTTESFPNGQIIALDKNQGPVISCGDDTTLILTEVQMPGKGSLSGAEFINGYQVKREEHFS